MSILRLHRSFYVPPMSLDSSTGSGYDPIPIYIVPVESWKLLRLECKIRKFLCHTRRLLLNSARCRGLITRLQITLPAQDFIFILTTPGSMLLVRTQRSDTDSIKLYSHFLQCFLQWSLEERFGAQRSKWSWILIKDRRRPISRVKSSRHKYF